MQKGHHLEFSCQNCQKPVRFSVLQQETSHPLECEHCQKKYLFEDETLKRQLKKFEALCRQIVESEEILGNTCVGIDVASHHVEVPYKILLTRLNSKLKLQIGNEPVTIVFRIEPTKDVPKN